MTLGSAASPRCEITCSVSPDGAEGLRQTLASHGDEVFDGTMLPVL